VAPGGQPAPPANDELNIAHPAILERLGAELELFGGQRRKIENRIRRIGDAQQSLSEAYAILTDHFEAVRQALYRLDIIGRSDDTLAALSESVARLVNELRGNDLDDIVDVLEGAPPKASPN